MSPSLPPFPHPGARARPLDETPLHRAGVRLRRAEQGDIPALARLYGLWRQRELLLAPWSAEQKQAFLDDQFRLQHLHYVRHFPKADFWVITAADAGAAAPPLGKLYVDRSTDEWRLIEILLAPDLQEKGLGSEMIAWLQHAAADAGATGVGLQVAAMNTRAHALYRRLGFEDQPDSDEIMLAMRWAP